MAEIAVRTLDESLLDGSELAVFDYAERRNRQGEVEGWVIYGDKPEPARIAVPPAQPVLDDGPSDAGDALLKALAAFRKHGAPPMGPPEPRPCKGRTCPALVLMVPTEASGGAKEIPLNPLPDDGGNVVVLNGMARVLGPLYVNDPRWDGHRYRVHFDTCPDIARFRARRKGRR